MNFKINGVKLVAGKRGQAEHLVVNGIETLSDGKHREAAFKYDRIPHADLKECLVRMRPHFAVLTSYLPEKASYAEKELEMFQVNGYSIGGADETLGIMILGLIRGKYGCSSVNSPFNRFEQPAGGYVAMSALEDLVDQLEAEVTLYCSGEKTGEVQMEMFEEAENGEKITKIQIAAPEERTSNLFVQEDGEIKKDPTAKQKQTQKQKRKQTPDNPSGAPAEDKPE